MTKKLTLFFTLALLAGLLGLAGCGGGGGGAQGSSSSGTDGAKAAAKVILSLSTDTIKADGSNSTTVTATVVDANNLPVADATVNFTPPASGHFGVSSGVSGQNGAVTIAYFATSASGAAVLTDRTDTINATVVGAGISEQISIKVTASSYTMLLGTSVSSIKSDGSNSATITATIMDSNNVTVPGQTVKFTTTSGKGQFGASSGVSNATGVVTIPFSAAISSDAAADWTNRTETVSGNIVGTAVKAYVPVKIEGSTLSLDSSKTTQLGAPVSLTATAKDLAAVGVKSQSIRFSISSGSGTLNGSASPVTVVTDANGTTPAVTLIGTAAGSLGVNADWMNSAGNSTYTASTTIAVTPVGVSFAVTAPATSPTKLTLGASQAISVSVPSLISGVTVANVRFATTLGTWANLSKSSTMTPVANAVTETLTAGANSGTASIQIDALDNSGNPLASLDWAFALSSVTGTQISLQPSVSTVAPSTGGATNTSTLTATVRDASNNTVGNAPVLFEIVNPTGSGEQIKPVIRYSDSNGQAVATFTSGATSTVGGLQIRASIVGTAVSDTKTINVAGNSVSVTIGQANVINSTDTSTTYTLPMSVLVVSSTGGAVPGATVTLSAFPTHYFRGSRNTACDSVYTPATQTVPGITDAGVTYALPNEDVNENDILDPGEDYDPVGDSYGIASLLSITPPHAASGTLPSTVVTNASGVGTFNLIYLKNYANWIAARIQARVVVSGTEFVNQLKFTLPPSGADTFPVCTLPNSPFGP